MNVCIRRNQSKIKEYMYECMYIYIHMYMEREGEGIRYDIKQNRAQTYLAEEVFNFKD